MGKKGTGNGVASFLLFKVSSQRQVLKRRDQCLRRNSRAFICCFRLVKMGTLDRQTIWKRTLILIDAENEKKI
jgi:hypothetical protein